MIKYVKGDLFDMVTPKTIIPHVCNNENKWGRGFVVPLMEHYMEARLQFDAWANGKSYKGRMTSRPYELGQTQFSLVESEVYVANMIGQVFYVTDGSIRQYRPLYYNKLADCMEQVALVAEHTDYKILAPKFGSVLAGGNWDFVECLIQDTWGDLDVTIVEYTPEKPQIRPYQDLTYVESVV